MESIRFSVTHIEDTHPQIIHIYNLDDGPRAIVLPHAHSEDADSSRPIRIFNALGEGGKVGMPFQKTFWAAGFGMLTDRFGIPWMINCEKAA